MKLNAGQMIFFLLIHFAKCEYSEVIFYNKIPDETSTVILTSTSTEKFVNYYYPNQEENESPENIYSQRPQAFNENEHEVSVVTNNIYKRRNAIRKTAATVQPIVDAVFPYIFVFLPLTLFIVIVFILFVIANSGEIDWYARHFDQRLFDQLTLDDVTVSATKAISDAFAKYNNGFSARKKDDVQVYFEPLVPYLFVGIPMFLMISVVSFIILTASSGSVEYFDTFKKDKGPVKYNNNYQNELLSNSLQARQKRSELDDTFGSFSDLQSWIDGHLGRYAEALTSEECMAMSACQLGIAAASLPQKELLIGVIDWLSPKNDGLFGGDRLDIMKSAANGELTSDACSNYKCKQPISHDIVSSKK